MYLLSYIRGDFVYCPVLLVLFSTRRGFMFSDKDLRKLIVPLVIEQILAVLVLSLIHI